MHFIMRPSSEININHESKCLHSYSHIWYRFLDLAIFNPIVSCMIWCSCSTIMFMPSENLASRGRSVTQHSSPTLTTDLEPRKMKSNHMRAPEISPTIEISSPRYPRQIPTSSSVLTCEPALLSLPSSMLSRALKTRRALSLSSSSATLQQLSLRTPVVMALLKPTSRKMPLVRSYSISSFSLRAFRMCYFSLKDFSFQLYLSLYFSSSAASFLYSFYFQSMRLCRMIFLISLALIKYNSSKVSTIWGSGILGMAYFLSRMSSTCCFISFMLANRISLSCRVGETGSSIIRLQYIIKNQMPPSPPSRNLLALLIASSAVSSSTLSFYLQAASYCLNLSSISFCVSSSGMLDWYRASSPAKLGGCNRMSAMLCISLISLYIRSSWRWLCTPKLKFLQYYWSQSSSWSNSSWLRLTSSILVTTSPRRRWCSSCASLAVMGSCVRVRSGWLQIVYRLVACRRSITSSILSFYSDMTVEISLNQY